MFLLAQAETSFADAVGIEFLGGAFTGFFAVLAAGVAAHVWNIDQQRRELELTAAEAFFDQYGEFFAVWKLWNYHLARTKGDPHEDTRATLLERATNAETRVEAIFFKLTTERDLSHTNIEDLGTFRQCFQELRQSIRDDIPLPWSSSDHPQYSEFKRLAPKVATLIQRGNGTVDVVSISRADNWRTITSNKFEDFWIDRSRQDGKALKPN